MRSRISRYALGAGVVSAGVALTLFLWAPPCAPAEDAPRLTSTRWHAGSMSGRLEVGAARVPLELPWPIVRGGYGPGRPEATTWDVPLYARALSVRLGDGEFALVALDTLTAPASLRMRLQRGLATRPPTGSAPALLWLAATHTHASPGGYDRRLVSQLAGTGGHRQAVEDALVDAASRALREARQRRRPSSLRYGRGEVEGLNRHRGGEGRVDPSLAQLVFDGARLVTFGAHPTVFPHEAAQLSADWPGAVSRGLEEEGAVGAALVLQGAGGDASAHDPLDVASFATRVLQAVETVGGASLETWAPDGATSRLLWAEGDVLLPRADATRLVPDAFTRPVERVLCDEGVEVAHLSLLQLGPVRLLALPFEVTADAALALEKASGGAYLVSLTNGYLGYVEAPSQVVANVGEARRQYFTPELLPTLVAGVERLAALLETASRSSPETSTSSPGMPPGPRSR